MRNYYLGFFACVVVVFGGFLYIVLVDKSFESGVALDSLLNSPYFNAPYYLLGSDSGPKLDKPLNVLVFYPDDWRHDSIGGVGPVVQTPFLNKLARKGIHFTENCATTSICWISRATYFTGQYASRHQSMRLRKPVFYKHWNTSWPGLLRDAGYYTGHVGKWQFNNPQDIVKTMFNWTKLHEGRHWFQPEKNRHVHASDHSKNEAIKFLRTRPKDRPFSLTVAFYPPKAVGNSHVPGAQWSHKNESASLYVNDTIPKPHGSWETLPWFFHSYEKIGRSRWKERFEGDEKYQISMKNYYRLITEVDAAAEQVFGELKTQGILNETLVIFTTDNGFFHGEHGLAGKWYPYHESIRLPLIIYDPRMPKSKRGTMDDSFTLNIDLAETILGAARIKPPPLMQGRDMADLYLPNRENKSPWRKEFFYEFKLNNGLSFPMATALVRKEFKYINWPQFKYEQLFDLINDPLELNDIVNMTEYKDILEEMRERHNILEKEVV